MMLGSRTRIASRRMLKTSTKVYIALRFTQTLLTNFQGCGSLHGKEKAKTPMVAQTIIAARMNVVNLWCSLTGVRARIKTTIDILAKH